MPTASNKTCVINTTNLVASDKKRNRLMYLFNLLLSIVYLTIYPKYVFVDTGVGDLKIYGFLVSVILPCVILFITCPRNGYGMKIPLIFTGLCMICYYKWKTKALINGVMYSLELSMKSSDFSQEYFVKMMSNASNLEIYSNCAIGFAILLSLAGSGIIYNIIQYKKMLRQNVEENDIIGTVGDSVAINTENSIQQFSVNIFDINTYSFSNKRLDVDTLKFPPSKFADNNTYYAIEKFRDGKKVRIYYTKENWNKQIENNVRETDV